MSRRVLRRIERHRRPGRGPAERGKGTDSNSVLLTLSAGALPGWATGIIAFAGAAAATVPAGTMCIAISTVISHNLVRPSNPRTGFVVNHGVVVIAAALALALGVLRPDLLANLMLLTLSGLAQLAPALVAGLGSRYLLSTFPAALGLLVGEIVITWFMFGDVDIARINTGILALMANVLVATAAELGVRLSRWRRNSRARPLSGPVSCDPDLSTRLRRPDDAWIIGSGQRIRITGH